MPKKSKKKAKNNLFKKKIRQKETKKAVKRKIKEPIKSKPVKKSEIKIVEVSNKGLEKAVKVLEKEEETKEFLEFNYPTSNRPINTGLDQVAPIGNQGFSNIDVRREEEKDEDVKYDSFDSAYSTDSQVYKTEERGYSGAQITGVRGNEMRGIEDIRDQRNFNDVNIQEPTKMAHQRLDVEAPKNTNSIEYQTGYDIEHKKESISDSEKRKYKIT